MEVDARVALPITVIEGKGATAGWRPRHLLERATQWSADDRVEEATVRREAIKGEVVQRVRAHHVHVRHAAARRSRRSSKVAQTQLRRLTQAAQRRETMVMTRLSRLSEHNKRIEDVLARGRASTPSQAVAVQKQKRLEDADARREHLTLSRLLRVSEHHKRIEDVLLRARADAVGPAAAQKRLEEATARRVERLKAQQERRKRHQQRIADAQSRRRAHEAAHAQSSKRAVTCFKLDADLIEESNFAQMQRKLMSRQTVTHAKDLLALISDKFDRLLIEEKVRTSDDTPVGHSSPMRSMDKLGLKLPENPKAFLAAYICRVGLTEPGSTQEVPQLERAVQAHAGDLLAAVRELLAALERADGSEDPAMREFARRYASFDASFTSWKRQDKRELLEHYIMTYSEVERGRVDIVAQTAVRGTRKPEEHAEFLAAVDASLTSLRDQIERIGGRDGLDALAARLQTLYETNALNVTPRSSGASLSGSPSRSGDTSLPTTPTMSALDADADAATTPNSSIAFSPSVADGSFASATAAASSDAAVADALRTLRLKARLAHDAVFKGCPLLQAATADAGAVLKDDADDVADQGIRLHVDASDAERADAVKALRRAADRAFYDSLKADLSATPPQTQRLAPALDALKNALMEVTPKKHNDEVARELREHMDIDLIATSLGLGTLRAIVKYFMDKVLAYEAPAKNAATSADVAALLARIDCTAEGDAAGIVAEALAFVQRRLETLAEDIHEARKALVAPILARDSGAIVGELLDAEMRAYGHNLEQTSAWLQRTVRAAVPGEHTSITFDKIYASGVPPAVTADDVAARNSKLYSTVPVLGLLMAVLCPEELAGGLPETLAVHHDVLKLCVDAVQGVVLAAAMAGVAGQLAGGSCAAGIAAEKALELLDAEDMTLDKLVDGVGDAVAAAANEHARPLAEHTQQLLTGMLRKVVNTRDAVYAAYHARLAAVLYRRQLCGADAAPLKGTPFAPCAARVDAIAATLRQLVRVNMAWYRGRYNDILAGIDRAGGGVGTTL